MLEAIFNIFFEYFPMVLIGFALLLLILNGGGSDRGPRGRK